MLVAAAVTAQDNVSDTIVGPPPLPHDPVQPGIPIPSPDNFPVPLDLPHLSWADSIRLFPLEHSDDEKYLKLTEDDYREVAEEMGVELAAIKAVVDIEAGKAHEGFYMPGKPLINFDLAMYKRFAPKNGVSLAKARKKSPVIFRSPDIRRYGSYQAAQWARLEAARAFDDSSALESCFWGMFQIGGFNWKLCGCATVQEFVERMSKSEREQLELFAALIRQCGMLEPLQKKQWLAFALKYNGPRARSRGYHTRMAASYARHSKP